MSSMSRGKPAKAQKAYKVVKPKKNTKRTTISNRNHRFQSFNERISTLKIDPIRRKRHVEAEEKAQEETHTLFGQSLEEWRETNLSQTFTAFSKEASLLCDNLAMVLYNEKEIMDLLCRYIEKGDVLAMEPLLNLLSHFAHDLDTRFEAHFPRAVTIVTAMAAKHADFAVIEWSFTCLAWLFKYLSRLLTPDLRPLYDLMAPYLGKESQKPFIVRFTAESLSFLVRKAAVIYERDQGPLDLVVEHMLKDGSANGEEDEAMSLHQQGIMTLVTEAVKGVQNSVNPSGVAVLQSLFRFAGKLANDGHSAVDRIVSGVLTSLVHHCTSDTFKPVLETFIAFAESSLDAAQPFVLRLCSNMLFTVISVRKATRITTWKKTMEVVKRLVSTCEKLPALEDEPALAVLSLLALATQSATIDAVLATRQILETLRTGKWAPYFLKFCDMFLRLGSDRFNDFVLPHFQKSVLEMPEGNENQVYMLLPRIASGKPDLKVKCRPETEDALFNHLNSIVEPKNGMTDALARANLQLKAMPFLAISDALTDRIRKALLQVVDSTLQQDLKGSDDFQQFALGIALERLLQIEKDASKLASLWIPLCTVSENFIALPRFCKNLLAFMKHCKPTELQGPHFEVLGRALISSLALPSHEVRQSGLDVLEMLYSLRGSELPASLSTAIRIESIPISLDASRSISMNIRKLATEYHNAGQDEIAAKAIPTYCFGLLHLNLAQAWDDAISALASISQSKVGEDVLMDLAQAWLEKKADTENQAAETPTIIDVESDGFKALSDFECPNLAKSSAISRQVFKEPSGGFLAPSNQLKADHKRVPTISLTARSQALKVLSKIPNIAEKRSRLLVPVLLNWAGSDSVDEGSDEAETDRWARKDQKAMLAIFAQFVNPRVLYRSTEVYTALLSLCANGDVEIQRSALKAILAWKESAITRYEEHLNNLLDEARFREELSVSLRDDAEDEEEDGIRAEDHQKLMPVLLRLLYGRAVAGGKEGQSGRRKAIFVALSRFGETALGQFLDIALPFAASDESEEKQTLRQLDLTPRQQFGMLNMVNDMLQTLGAELEQFISKLLSGILSCTVSASKKLDQGQQENDLSLLRSIRQSGMQCLVKVFSHMTEFDPKPYGKFIVDELIAPRLPTFASENAQSVSGVLRLLSAWSERKEAAQLFQGTGAAMLTAVADLLQAQHTKDGVRLFILQELVANLVKEDADEMIVRSHVSTFVRAIGSVIRQQSSKDVLDASVDCFSKLAGLITSGEEAAEVTKICSELLVKPGKMVSPRTKTGLLRTLLPLVERFQVTEKDELYTALCALFSRLQEPESRLLLAEVVGKLVKDQPDLLRVSKTCEDMNAMGTRLDEPDHDRRERALAFVYDSAATFSLQQWLPVVHNCLYYVRDSEDRVNRLSASHALQLFVDSAANHAEEDAWKALLEDAVYAGIERGMREQSELVRAEYLAIQGHIVEKLPNWPKVSGLASLVVGGDEEASFFPNVLHIQQHRRLRALRRLAEEAASVGSQNASRILLPLLEHFVFDQAEGDAGRTLADQAVQTIGALAQALNKSAFRATFQRYTSYLKSKEELEKTVLRILSALVDGMQNAPQKERSSKAIIEEQLPPLLEYLHQKDESTVDRRMPVAVTIVKLMKMLPSEDFMARLPGVLTDVCHVLRSRSQEARDETRKALKAVSSLVGPQYFRFIVKELRGALKRGYQLHVLSFTVHALLVDAQFGPGDVDECLPDLMLVIMDDIFGVTGQEKDAEEYKSGMREVKSSKSYDTMELLARVTPINKLGELIRPIRSLLSEKINMKNLRKIDELLTRLRKGLDQNAASDSRDMLGFCWEIVSQVYAEQNAPPAKMNKVDERRKRYLVQPEAPKDVRNKGATTSYQFKLISFALNLLRKVVRRHEDLQTPQNMAGFLPMAGDGIVQGQEEVKLSAVRLLSTIMRVPLAQLDANAPVYAKEAVAMIKGAIDMTTDAAKAALELLTSVLREKRSVDIKERDIATVLKRIGADIDEPDRQGIIYKFLRAVLGRKILITEVYETMDEVGKAMVTNPDRQVRESARSAYLQFVMEYPQGKDRWQKQTAFLVGNLQYEHSAGRQSVMEFLHQMLGKIGEDVLAEIGAKIFVSLLPVIVSDSDNSCRDMARLLVGKLFERVGSEQLTKYLSLMETWLRKEKKASIKAGALQCWAILLRARPLPQKQVEGMRDKLEDIISDCAEEETIAEPQLVLDALQAFAVLVETAPAVGFARASADLWQGIQQLPSSDNAQVQESVASLLGTFFTDVASTSSKTADGLAGLPLRGSGGLEIGAEDMRRLSAVNLRALRSVSLATAESLTAQIVRNLVFLGRCFAANEMPSREDAQDEEASDNEKEDDAAGDKFSALPDLLRRLSSMIMAEKFSIISRTAALQCCSAIINQISTIPNLQTVLRPLYALTDPTVTKPPGDLYKALEEKANEALDLIQKKIGSEAYVAALATTRAEAKSRREERRQKRRIEAVAEPERWAAGKKRKYEGKREKKKLKGAEARGKRRGW